MKLQKRSKNKLLQASLCMAILLLIAFPLLQIKINALTMPSVTTNIPDPDVNTTIIPGTDTIPQPSITTPAPSTDSSTLAPIPPATTPITTTASQTTSPQEQSSGYLGWVITLIVIAIIAAILIAILAFMPKKDK